jgi:hypothetical protein
MELKEELTKTINARAGRDHLRKDIQEVLTSPCFPLLSKERD